MTIKPNTALRVFGLFLSLAHLLTFLFWLNSDIIHFLSDEWRVCWPLFGNCEGLPRFSFPIAYAVLGIYFFAGLAASTAYAGSWDRTAWWALSVATILKAFLYLQDFRMMGNYHYMHFWLLVAFLLLPQKLTVSRLLILGFYLSAGLLKLNFEWLSGSALLRETFLTGKPLEWALVYVVLLELALVFGLFSNRSWIFWLTMAQLTVFHGFSFFVVGWFYPSVMICFLSVFLLARWSNQNIGWASLRSLDRFSVAALITFVLMQLSPLVLGHPRLALNMLDRMPDCEFFAFGRYQNEVRHLSSRYHGLEPRLRCELPVYQAAIYHLCREQRANSDFINMDVALIAKMQTEQGFRTRFEMRDVCSKVSSP